MTPAQDRVIRAAAAFAEAGTTIGLGSLDSVPSRIIHEVYDAVRGLREEPLPGPIRSFPPEGKLAPNDEGQIKLLISEWQGQIRFDFGKATAWFAIPKPAALQFAFVILERCGVEISHKVQQDPAHE